MDGSTAARSAEKSLEVTVVAGFSLLALFMALGMAFSINRFQSEANGQIQGIHDEESEIRQIERLRWFAEVLVSSGRGYLLAGEPSLLAQVRVSQAEFHRALEVLRSEDLTPAGRALSQEAEQAASRFLKAQAVLLDARQLSSDPRALVDRFESELLPPNRELDASLMRLLKHKERMVRDHYDQARQARASLAQHLYGLLAILMLAALGVAWRFSKRLGLAFRREQEALASARKALAARDELMGIVAHDLRNPLGAITMKTALLRRSAESDRTRRHAESIENVAMRMKFLIETMLDVTTLEAGRFTVNVARYSIADLLRDTADMFGALAAGKQLRFEQRVESPGLALLVDRERVLQVFSNLIGNAFKFTPPGGHVRLCVERQGAMVRFGVLDTGPGIAPANLPRVFERFWTQTPGKKGTGLGLFIAKGIVDAHGGRIWVESGPGQGTSFFFTLPIAETATEPVATVQADHSPQPL
jgi:signal transduction histidine kinase